LAVLVAGVDAAWRLSRWRGLRTLRKPLLLECDLSNCPMPLTEERIARSNGRLPL